MKSNNNRNSTSSPISKIIFHDNGKVELYRKKNVPKNALNKTLNNIPYRRFQLLINPSFTLWENAGSPVGWKGEGISREDDVTNTHNGKSALRMTAGSYIYQYISYGLSSNVLYLATIHARVSTKNLNVPLVANIQFFNDLGAQLGYTTQIILDHTTIDTHDHEFKVSAEAPKGAKTASFKLSVETSDGADNGKSYLIDEVTFTQY